MEYLFRGYIRQYREQFDKIIQDVKIKMGSEWTFNYYLVGSARRNLVLDSNEGFDLDYHLELHKYPQSMSHKDIKMEFKDAFDKVVPNYELRPCEDSTHVLTTKHFEGDQLKYSYDIAIIRNEAMAQILKNEKANNGNGPYHFVDIPNGSNFHDRYSQIKGSKMWNDLRDNYKIKKETQHKDKKEFRCLSFSLLISSVNEILQKYGKI